MNLSEEMKKRVNKVYHGDSAQVLKTLPDESVDMGIMSPPYDLARSYEGYEFDFCTIANELARVLKPGGVLVWVVQDTVIDGSESGTSFKQALYFKQKSGLNIHDTMIWQKTFLKYPEKIRYHNSFEYMFVFSKGKPKTINIIEDRQNFWGGALVPGRERQADGTKKEACTTGKKYKDIGARWNVWAYPIDGLSDPKEITAAEILSYVNRGYVILDPNGKRCDVWAVKNTWDRYLKMSNDHPAVFPEELVRDHIITWSNPGDVIIDPFGGSGTTAVMAKSMNRYYISIDVSKKYCEDQVKRLKNVGIFHECAQIDNN